MSLAGITSTPESYVSQFTTCIVRNWQAFKNKSVVYANQFWNSHYIKKIVVFISSYFNKIVAYYPDWAKISWSTSTAVATAGVILLSLSILSYFDSDSNSEDKNDEVITLPG